MSQRRNRVVDRLQDQHAAGDPHGHVERLRHRARFSLLAMLGCILACVLVTALVAVMSVAMLHGWRTGPPITALMPGAMFPLGAGLLCFLAEAALARTDLPPPAP